MTRKWTKRRVGFIVALVALGTMITSCGTVDEASGIGAAPLESNSLTPSPIPQTPMVPTPTRGPLPSPTTAPPPGPPMTEIPAPPPVPPRAAAAGITYGRPTELPKISRDEAIELARVRGGLPANVPQDKLEVHYVLFTNPRLGPNADGTQDARDQPVWLVTAHDVPLVPSRPGPLPGMTPEPVVALPSDVTVVIDAMTGRWIETYSF